MLPPSPRQQIHGVQDRLVDSYSVEASAAGFDIASHTSSRRARLAEAEHSKFRQKSRALAPLGKKKLKIEKSQDSGILKFQALRSAKSNGTLETLAGVNIHLDPRAWGRRHDHDTR